MPEEVSHLFAQREIKQLKPSGMSYFRWSSDHPDLLTRKQAKGQELSNLEN